MRPLIVLLLVLTAVTALSLAFYFSGRGPEPEGGGVAPIAPTTTTSGVKEAGPTKTPLQPLDQEDVVRGNPDPVGGDTEGPDNEPVDLSNSLFGQVLNEQTQPLVDATVMLSRDPMMDDALATFLIMGPDQPRTGKVLTTTTDAKGQYRFQNVEPARDYYVVAKHSEYAPKQEQLVSVSDEGDCRGPDIILRVGTSVWGTVSDEGDAPVAKAKLDLDSAFFSGEGESPDRITVHTDEGGNYEFKNVPPGPRSLTVRSEGSGTQTQSNVHIKGTAGERIQQNFKLLTGQPIAGRVVGSDGLGIQGARITAFNAGTNQSFRGDTVSIEDGQFQIDDLHPGSYILQAEAKGYRQQKHTRVQTGNMNVQIDMLLRACVEGRVVDASSGQPVASFTCSVRRVSQPQGAGSPRVYEDAGVSQAFDGRNDGTFQLCGLDPGLFAILASSPSTAPTLSDTFQVVENQRVANILVRLTSGGSIRGRVVGPDGTAIRGAVISSHDDTFDEDPMESFLGGLVPSNVTVKKTRTDAQGNFELRLLTPEKYQIRISHPTFTREKVRGLNVQDGIPTDVGTIQLRAGGTVRGMVRDQAGKQLPRAFIHLEAIEGDLVYDTRSDADGRYSIQHVRPGTYTLSATSQSPGGGDAFNAVIDQRQSAVQINVIEGGEIPRDLNLGG